MAKPTDDAKKTENSEGSCADADTTGEAPAAPLTLAERANLARNLYALNDWLRTHLEP